MTAYIFFSHLFNSQTQHLLCGVLWRQLKAFLETKPFFSFFSNLLYCIYWEINLIWSSPKAYWIFLKSRETFFCFHCSSVKLINPIQPQFEAYWIFFFQISKDSLLLFSCATQVQSSYKYLLLLFFENVHDLSIRIRMQSFCSQRLLSVCYWDVLVCPPYGPYPKELPCLSVSGWLRTKG